MTIDLDANSLDPSGELVSEELYQKCCVTDATAGVKVIRTGNKLNGDSLKGLRHRRAIFGKLFVVS